MFKFVLPATLLIVAAPVFAQDSPSSFNGPFVGIQGGWQQDRQSLDVSNGGRIGSNKNDGVAYGGQIGYDFRISPSFVIGAEAALTGRSGSGIVDYGFGAYDLRQGRTITATARFGYAIAPSDLLYVRAGYANANYKIDTAPGTRFSTNRDGYTIGAGYERMLTQNVSARVEYGYSDFGSDKSFGGVGGPNGVAEVKYRRHAVTAGVNYRF